MWYAAVSLNPSIGGLPGGAALQKLVDGIGAWAEVGSLVALVVGAGLWALGSHTQNMHQSAQGRKAVVTSFAAAILIGGAPHIINFFFSAGQGVH